MSGFEGRGARTRAAAVVLAAAILMAGCRGDPMKKIDQGFAGFTAEATARIAGNGEVVIFATSPDDVFADPTIRQKADELTAALKAKGFTVKAVENIPLNRMIEQTGEPVAAKDFMAAVARHSSAAAIISLVGVPRIGAAEIAQLPKPRPKLMVATTYLVPYLGQLPPGFLDWVLIPAMGGENEPGEPALDGLFRVIAPAGK